MPRNDSAAFAYMDTALQLGQWRAPYALALMHALGKGAPVNTTAEQGDWTAQLQDALAALDSGA